jgi:hypothetical protein
MYEKIFGVQHRLTVLRLYKTILRLHQSLPYELRELGNQYVRDEFHRHKNAQPEFVTNFMVEWSEYARILTRQASSKTNESFGLPIGLKILDRLNEDQLVQLYDLYSEIKKASESNK